MITKDILIQYNNAYRLGNPLVSNAVYDLHKQQWETEYGKLNLLDYGFGEKVELKHIAGSLDKIDSYSELLNFLSDEDVIYCAPKLDGISIVNEKAVSSTRGDDGRTGNNVTHHFINIKNGKEILNDHKYSRGEVVLSWKAFSEHFETIGRKHPRNTVSGLFNPETKESNKNLIQHVEFIEFFGDDGSGDITLSRELWGYVKKWELTEEKILEMYNKWSSMYPCDGLVFSIGNKVLYKDGSVNPSNVIAYKPKHFNENTKSIVVRVERHISKYGVLNPVLTIKPVNLSGATIKNIYVDNEAFVKSLGIGEGTEIELIRSGGIIPRLVKVNGIELSFERDHLTKLMKDNSNNLTNVFEILNIDFGDGSGIYAYSEPECNYVWRGLDVIKTDLDNGVLYRKIEYFFQTLGCKEIGSKTIQFICKMYSITSLESFLQFDFDLLLESDGYDLKSVQKLKKGMTPLKKVTLHKLMQATSFFEKLGAEKLKLYITGGVETKGLGEYAKSEITKNLPRWVFFRDFYEKSLGFEIIEIKSDGDVYCHTMCRIPKDIIQKMEAEGKSVVDSYSKKVKILVVPNLDTTSSKIKKGIEDGVQLLLLSELIGKYTKKEEETSLF